MTIHAVSRRSFLKTATVASIGMALAACQPIPPMAEAEPAMGPITAAQVSDPESLKAFVHAAKDEITAITKTLDDAAKLKQWVKTEGDWNSGSTYLIILAANGAVFAHGTDREAEDRNVMDIEDEQGTKVVQELIAAAAQGGGFVEYYDDGICRRIHTAVRACGRLHAGLHPSRSSNRGSSHARGHRLRSCGPRDTHHIC